MFKQYLYLELAPNKNVHFTAYNCLAYELPGIDQDILGWGIAQYS